MFAHVHVRVCVFACVSTYMYVSLHVLVNVGMHECMYWLHMLQFYFSSIEHIRTYAYTCIHMPMHTFVHTCMPIHTYTHTDIHPYTYTDPCSGLTLVMLIIPTSPYTPRYSPQLWTVLIPSPPILVGHCTSVDNPGANGRIYWTGSCYDGIESAALHGGDRIEGCFR